MADNNETLILRVSLDEGKTQQRLQQLVLDLDKTRAAQRELNLARKAGTVDDAAYAARTVELKAQLKGQQVEQTALTKNLELYRTAVDGTGTSYKNVQAQLSLAQRQYQQLDGSAENSTEATQALAQTIDGLRNTLKETDAQQSLFVRNIGNYPKGENVAQLLQELVKLQEAQKGVTQSSEEAARAQMRISGFQTAAQQALAKEGKTYDEATSFIQTYTAAIRPATAALVKLEQEEQQLVETTGEASEQVQKIGFRLASLQQDIKAVPVETKKMGTELKEAAKTSGLFGGALDTVSEAKEKYTAIANLARAATAGETTALGLLRVAFIATGIGAFVVILGSLFAFLTKTQQGTDFLSRKLGGLKAVVTVLTNVVADFGGELFKAANDPKQGFEELVDFLEDQVVNRITSIGVLIDGIRTGSLSKIADSFIQFNLGITNGTDKLRAFGAQASAAAAAGERLAQMERELGRAETDNITTNKSLLNQVERLKNVRDNEFNSLATRRAANEAAYTVELQRENQLAKIAQQRIDLLTAKLKLEGGRDKNEDLYKELKEAENELADIREDAAGKQNELITNRYQLEQERIDRVIARRKEALDLEAVELEQQLRRVRAGSDEELNLLQRKLNNARAAELNVKALTAGQKLVIDKKYEGDSLALTLDFGKKRIVSAYEDSLAASMAELAAVKKGTDAETELRREAIDIQLNKELAALDKRKDNAAQEALLRANAANALNDVNYNAALTKLNTFLDAQRQALEESNAKGELSSKEYADAALVSEQISIGARTQLARDYKQDTVSLEREAAQLKIKALQSVTDAERAAKERRIAQAQELAEGLTSLFAETVATTGTTLEDFLRKSLILVIDSVEKTIIGEEIKIIAQAFASAESLATYGIAGAAKSAAIIGLTLAATETLKAQLRPKKDVFEQGTVLQGPSHAAGGVQLYSPGGYHFGEAEGGEAIINRRATAMFLPALSLINQAGGGKPLHPTFNRSAFMQLGGVTSALVRESVNGRVAVGSVAGAQTVQVLDAKAVGAEVAGALKGVRLGVAVQDIKAGLNRADFTDSRANF